MSTRLFAVSRVRQTVVVIAVGVCFFLSTRVLTMYCVVLVRLEYECIYGTAVCVLRQNAAMYDTCAYTTIMTGSYNESTLFE
jgi:hypothetical protein